MTSIDAYSAISGIQSTISALNGTTSATRSSSATVFADLLAKITGATTSTQDAFGQSIVDKAKAYIGTPYVLGGTTTSGIDCSGLVKSVLADYGIDVPHDSGLQGDVGTEVPSLADARPGDLIVFKGGHHIGIYAGDGKVIHAPSPGRTVTEQQLWTGDEGIETIRRVEAPATATTGTDLSGIDLQSVLAGLSMLGNLSTMLGSSVLGSSVLGSSVLGSSALGSTDSLASLLGTTGSTSSSSSPSSPTSDLAALELQRWALLAKGTTS